MITFNLFQVIVINKTKQTFHESEPLYQHGRQNSGEFLTRLKDLASFVGISLPNRGLNIGLLPITPE